MFFKSAIIFACIAAANATGLLHQQAEFTNTLELTESVINTHFSKFMSMHNKQYSETEEPMRRAIFAANLKQIHQHNVEAAAGKHSWTMAQNEFTDLTADEFEARLRTFSMPAKAKKNVVAAKQPLTDLPETVDWVSEGVVTPVKNQQRCGSCWAFSTTGAVEGAHALKTGKLVSVSEQELVDCDPEDLGCHGGLMDNAFNWIIENNGLCTEEAYPYKGVDGRCKKLQCESKVTISDFEDIEESWDSLREGIARQPISVAVEATAWQHYDSGVFDGCDSMPSLNHGVLAVGYDVKEGFIKIKNSWGSAWGEDGYIRLAISENRHGMCGVHMVTSYPIV